MYAETMIAHMQEDDRDNGLHFKHYKKICPRLRDSKTTLAQEVGSVGTRFLPAKIYGFRDRKILMRCCRSPPTCTADWVPLLGHPYRWIVLCMLLGKRHGFDKAQAQNNITLSHMKRIL